MAGKDRQDKDKADEKPELAETVAVLGWIKRHVGVHLDYEIILERAYRALIPKDAVVADVGASKGRHARPLLECIGPNGKIFLFEPLPADFRALQKKFRRDNRVVLANVALSDRGGRASFIVAEGDEAESGLRQRRYNRPLRVRPRTIEVDVATLDDRLAIVDRLDYLKIDIEGGEIDCLKGAEATIRRFRPLISVEYGVESYKAYGYEMRSLFDLAAGYDYALMDLFGSPIPTLDQWLQVCDRAYWDYWLIPRERVDEIAALLSFGATRR